MANAVPGLLPRWYHWQSSRQPGVVQTPNCLNPTSTRRRASASVCIVSRDLRICNASLTRRCREAFAMLGDIFLISLSLAIWKVMTEDKGRSNR